MDVFDFKEERDVPTAKFFFKSRNGSKHDSFQTKALEYSCYKDFKRDKAAILQREMPYLTKKQIEGKVKYMWTKLRNKAKVAQNGRQNKKAMGFSAPGSRNRTKSRLVWRVDSPEMETETRRTSSRSQKQEGVAKLSFSDVHFQENFPKVDSPDEDGKIRRTSPRNKKRESTGLKQVADVASGSGSRVQKTVMMCSLEEDTKQVWPQKKSKPTKSGSKRMNVNPHWTSETKASQKIPK